MTTLQERLDHKEIIILDAGNGTELQRRGVPMHSIVWCAAAMKTHAETVREVHEEYIRAGADVITANTYSNARYLLELVGLEDEIGALNRQAIELVWQARDATADRPIWIAGSISSVPSWELSTGNTPTADQAKADYREQAELLAAAGVDLIAVEMMMEAEDTTYAVEAALATGLPVWVGFSCQLDGATVRMLRAPYSVPPADPVFGPEFGAVVDEIMALGGQAAGVMHSKVDDTAAALKVLAEHWSGPALAYAESGDYVMPDWRFGDVISPEDYAAKAMEWIDLGVQIIGGCCGTGPEHIRVLKERMPEYLPD